MEPTHLSVNKSFLSQKLNLTITLNEVLYTDYFLFNTTYSDQNFYMRERRHSRRFRFALSYRFGKMQIQQRLNTVAAQGITSQNKERDARAGPHFVIPVSHTA